MQPDLKGSGNLGRRWSLLILEDRSSWFSLNLHQKPGEIPLVMTNIAMENHHPFIGKLTISMASLNGYICLPERSDS